ncbi:putative actin interacting protein 3 [Lyophyllum shimeji]|uniref:Actin interacting protein 3 n=1 Tax=Lyophyllum shimeji TaxID=47721 RepID=A0A9P3PUJ4_LYOSH|nr:putative actin interacting protein 3 [Lyophyllum shimeji]
MSSRSNGGQSHSSRRDNPSVSSTSSGRNERGTRHGTHPAVESAVTRLLVSIKQLLESLTLWSTLKIDENAVSDVYVRLGNDFNAAVAAFAAFGIDMTELMSVPDDLRNVLEQCLAEDATPENLELYLPTVRKVITDLLTGLRGKQSIYRRIVSDHRRGSEQSGGGHERTESRSSRGERSSRRGEQIHRSQLSRTLAEGTMGEGERPDRDSTSRRSGTSSSGRRKDSTSQAVTPSNNDERFVGGFVPPVPEQPQPPRSSYEDENTAVSYDSQAKPRHPSQPSDSPSPYSSPRGLPSTPVSNPPTDNTPKPPPPSVVPASVKRYSLVDKPMSSPPAVVVEPSSPALDQDNASPAQTPVTPPSELPPAMANSLAALKKSDVLERRASKRFSTFNISKMTGGSTRERPGRGSGHPNRRSLAASNALTPGELAVLTEVDDEEPHMSGSTSLRREGSGRSRSISRTATPERKDSTPPVPKLPKSVESPTVVEPADKPVTESEGAEAPADPSRITVFLQLGREVKKAVIEPNISFASLRVLFVDKFSYSPGQDNFPAIYIRDPSSGVQYELEDTDEVKEKCLLSLNIEPLDQIKQHIDSKISNLSADIKELKTAVANSARQPMLPPNIVAEPLAESTPYPNRPTDRQFQTVARRLSRFVGDSSHSLFQAQPSSPAGFTQIQSQITGQSLQPQMTGGSVLSDYSSRVVTDLKTQFDEVQNLRRDLGVMRQLYTEFTKQTKESLGTLRTQTQSVKQLANTSVGGARGYIDTGKKKLDTRSQNVLTEVEKLLDTVENMKDDVTKRQITPKEQYVKSIKKDIDSVAAELESLKEHIKTIKPMWKKTWEEELQNIVEEQQFLTHQEEFLNDLLEDHKAVVEVYGHIEKVISIRGSGPNGAIKPRSRSFKPPPPSEGDGLSNVMLEIRGAAVDPEKRMKAIEANQKNRQKELAARSNELHAELHDFVGGKKLRMTGGAEEAERVRQKRSEMTLRAMFNGGRTTTPPPDLPPSPQT